MQSMVICKGCSQSRPHHARGYCTNCYHKFIVRKTGDFDRGDQVFYQNHLELVKAKISATQKQRHSRDSSIASELTRERLKELYCDQGLSLGDIAKRFGCSRAYILLLMKKYGLPVRNKSAARAEAKRKGKNVGFNAINEDFFKEQTPEMAYVLGFIYSDGNLGNLLDHFSISQKEPEILYKIRQLMGSEHRIVRKTKQELYMLTIGNREMIRDLIQLGLTPNKSLDLRFPVLDQRLYSHFIRGYFDGDGSIYMSKNAWRVSFVSGSRLFMDGLQEKLIQLADTGRRPFYVFPSEKAFQFSYGSRADLIKIFKFIYDEDSIKKGIYLNRKYDLFLKFIVAKG